MPVLAVEHTAIFFLALFANAATLQTVILKTNEVAAQKRLAVFYLSAALSPPR